MRVTVSMSTGSCISRTPMPPTTRTSATPGNASAGRRWVRNPSLRRAIACAHAGSPSSFSPKRRSREALAAVHARGLAMKVGPCMRARRLDSEITSATSPVHMSAARVMYPPVRALPRHMMSGVIPARSHANAVPVRPNPVAISSAMKTAPRSRARAWRCWRARTW
ncbi:Uncharacterised protein [Mycobacteroides abscessus subsp. abscessus]|nr:Uncharacterised protein [Mycobacteroides abscessus subsp. abscessus]